MDHLRRHPLLEPPLGPPGYGPAGGQGLQAAPAAAVAAGPFSLNYLVAHLAGRPLGSQVEPVIGDDAAANAGADSEGEEVMETPAGPKGVLPQGGGAGIVQEKSGEAKPLLNPLPYGQVLELRDIWRGGDPPPPHVYYPRRGQADSLHPGISCPDEDFFNGCGELAQHHFHPPAGTGGLPGAEEDLSPLIDQGRAGIGAPHIHPHDQPFHILASYSSVYIWLCHPPGWSRYNYQKGAGMNACFMLQAG